MSKASLLEDDLVVRRLPVKEQQERREAARPHRNLIATTNGTVEEPVTPAPKPAPAVPTPTLTPKIIYTAPMDTSD